ncbi:hypothetical protein A2803_01725 [Candidatus Woesebacteria bacterium RIFCSPHIGHO2_01_FULL_44_21]|uniref:Type 4 fimbrial biogenesis protein PilX N-terminal domain-containing protein n=1 Tax=Candidatus Woesebacteria bacterium RIFCSPHIGHO2_01_FULL_44_21 TaxID=1802503 RepID=A0A1F7YXI8_9BACT|nr:MAG: hypothetical protein A2803_01725 [Candidatus Woesebacteria bacterium RIFCSPHIGHO2_01_FULL_44_21]OGM69592.1 MAG: hypothetical protein A2897_03240 [Candidatus Woesebacteria bacterium RIFCSPLOWO2_01_FULL_44_24b]
MNKGVVAISTVLVLGVVLSFVTLTLTSLSIGEAQSAFGLFRGEDTLQFVEGCAEDYMLKIRTQGSGFTAGNITRPEGTCSIVVNAGDPNWDITVSTTGSAYRRTVNVIFTRTSSGISLTSWKEI